MRRSAGNVICNHKERRINEKANEIRKKRVNRK
jgi:hypothetical protein